MTSEMAVVRVAEDRSMIVPAGKLVKTGYVPIDQIKLKCRDRMSIGDVEYSVRKRLAIGPSQPWPCPVGEWDGSRFVIFDGRHDYISALMLGLEYILVAWLIPKPDLD